MAVSFLAAIGVSAWLGWKADRIFAFRFPILVWLLPLICIIGLIMRTVMDTKK